MSKVFPTKMQYAGIATRAPFTRVAKRSARCPPNSTPGMPPKMINAPTIPVACFSVIPEKRSWNWGSQAPMPATVNISALMPTSA